MLRRTLPFVVLAAPFLFATSASAGPPVIDLDEAPVNTPQEVPRVSNASFLLSDGLAWGMPRADVLAAFSKVGGVVDKEYDPVLAKLPIGDRMRAVELDRDSVKSAFARSWIPFDDTPTGFDTTPLHAEYTYGNSEGLLYLQRDGRRRFFFFLGDKLWKIYDEVPLFSEEQIAGFAKNPGGPTPSILATSYNDAAVKLGIKLGAPPKYSVVDADHPQPTAEWQDKLNHLRLHDRGGFLGLVLEDKGMISKLGSLRRAKPKDNNEIDPLVKSIIRGKEPDAPMPPSADAVPKKDPPKKKGKK
jgi:hypothetical protein